MYKSEEYSGFRSYPKALQSVVSKLARWDIYTVLKELGLSPLEVLVYKDKKVIFKEILFKGKDNSYGKVLLEHYGHAADEYLQRYELANYIDYPRYRFSDIKQARRKCPIGFLVKKIPESANSNK